MGNATWACFECRVAVRRHTQHRGDVPCPQCGCDCVGLGTKIRVPVKSDEKAWQELRASTRETRLRALDGAEQRRVRHRHRLERRIADLESRPASPGRAKTLRLLREQLASL